MFFLILPLCLGDSIYLDFKDFIRPKIEYFIPEKNSNIFTDEAKYYKEQRELYERIVEFFKYSLMLERLAFIRKELSLIIK